ncbi:hypothetical protein FKR81_36295 [Lentzea tibetensis]|uniref:Uncharacterized protein n=1 Tax=Lentzea tibetensis TaxID=2591470 RepID=A0A563EIL9_9PSEU|nr:hypothetical protein [Lentzea tibetensis]TWP46401.1 hypothetical protein FKR81_36295 [Lentzea tibetensis]
MSAAESIAQFRSEVGAAVTRASRAAAEAGAANGALRKRTKDLADRAKSRQLSVDAHAATSPDLRGSATGFRADRGLPVEHLPEAADLLKPPPVVPEPLPKPTTLGSAAVAGPSGQLPHVSDDDEDFSQSRILY